MPIYMRESPDGGFEPVLNEDGSLMVFDEFASCQYCDAEESMNDTGCEVDGCYGFGCIECGCGCRHEEDADD